MKSTKKYLIARTNSYEYLIPLQNILFIEKIEYDENLNDKRIKKIKGSPENFVGVIHHKGLSFPIVDMDYILNQETTTVHNENKIIFIKFEKEYLGMQFNDVSEIKHFNINEQLFKTVDNLPLKVVSAENKNFFVIDIEKLFSISQKYIYLIRD